MLYELIVLLLAGIGTGIVTGLMGASAIVITIPIMVIFLNYDVFTGIGISLAIDVIASFVAIFVYRKNKNMDLRIGIPMAIIAVGGTILGTALSFYVPEIWLSSLTGIAVCFTGINMLTKKIKEEAKTEVKEFHLNYKSKKYIALMIGAFIIGILGGSFGAGGGLSLLIVLTLIAGFRIHKAIGTSVFVMVFIALAGSISHFIYTPFPIWIVAVAGIGAIFGSLYSSKIANALTEKQLNKLVGVILFLLGVSLIIKEVFGWIY